MDIFCPCDLLFLLKTTRYTYREILICGSTVYVSAIFLIKSPHIIESIQGINVSSIKFLKKSNLSLVKNFTARCFLSVYGAELSPWCIPSHTRVRVLGCSYILIGMWSIHSKCHFIKIVCCLTHVIYWRDRNL